MAINTTLSKNNKKEFLVDKMLREHCEFSFDDLLSELHLIRHELRDKEIYTQMVQFIILVISKAKYLLYKYYETLVMFVGECLNFYIRRKKNKNDEWQYSLVIGLDSINISFCSSNDYCENIIMTMVTKLMERCMADGHDITGKLDANKIEARESNKLESGDLPEYLL